MIDATMYNALNKEKNGILNINTYDYYFNTFRPFAKDIMDTCKTDRELYRTLDKVINVVDSLCVAKKYKEIPDKLEVLNIAINDKNYFTNGPMRRASEEEKDKVRTLINKLSDFLMIIQCEQPIEDEAKPFKERIDYSSPNGENKSYMTHNMKELNKKIDNMRLPNR